MIEIEWRMRQLLHGKLHEPGSGCSRNKFVDRHNAVPALCTLHCYHASLISCDVVAHLLLITHACLDMLSLESIHSEGLSVHRLTHVMRDCTGRHEWHIETQQTQGL